MNRIASEKYRLSSDKLKLVCTEKDAALFYDPEQGGDELDGLIGKEPEDWCYLNNFDAQDQPLAVSHPAGQGRIFQTDMDALVEDLKVFIPKAFQSSVYEKKKTSIVESLKNKMDSLFQRMEEVAGENSYTLQQIPPGSC